jgi:phosphoglycolate phosphatase-like HAD superfamily hydrolase
MAEPLQSWNSGAVKSSILDFVTRVTKEGGPDFVPPSERIATFDNDGTLWCEHPLQVQVFFLIDRVKELAAHDPALRQRQPFKALLEHDLKALQELGKKGLQELFFATHAGMTDEQFVQIACSWIDQAKHPKFGALFKRCTYLPQIELLDYLHAHQFRTFIVSGGGVDFMRTFAEAAYGIPPERITGSSVRTSVEVEKAAIYLKKLPELGSFDDREVKVQNIGLHIGRRPILAFGNSDGDLAMLRYCKTGPGARLALLVHHDDAERESAYDREFKLSPLAEALDKAKDYGITITSMKNDWRVVFGPTKR